MATEPRAASRPFSTPLVVTLLFLLVVVAVLLAGGLYVRSIVGASFQEVEAIRIARVHTSEMLRLQLDEETGIRGYAAVRLPILLSAYYGGRATLPLYFDRVASDLAKLNIRTAVPALDDAIKMNSRWVHQVAFPLVRTRRAHRSLLLHGKRLVDRYRIDVAAIDAALARKAVSANARAQAALLWVSGLALAAIIAIVVAAAIFTLQQYRLSLRLERQRAASEAERRRLAEVRAAYETEKRIADILQEAFSERVFPDVPALRFSATYIPAGEQAKIGGDWYDALQLSQDRVLLAIGDVTGHGIDAVVAMNKARQLLIGSALLDTTPHHVLERVNEELVRAKSPIMTAVAAILDTRTHEFAYAAAGHPPPVLFEPDRGARLLDFGSLPLGVAPRTPYETHRLRIVAGAMIVLYTDGAIEYSRNLAEGETALLAAVEAAANAPKAEAAKLIQERIFGSRNVTDDVAILATTFRPEVEVGNLSQSGRNALGRSA